MLSILRVVRGYIIFISIIVEPTAFQLISTFLEKAGAVEGQVLSVVTLTTSKHVLVSMYVDVYHFTTLPVEPYATV